MNRWFAALLAAMLLAASGSWSVAPATAGAGTDRLTAGERLYANQYLVSRNGQYVLRMQGDGNLVIYAPGNVPVWATGTRGAAFLGNQGDGNLVVYTTATPHAPLWASNTAGNGFSTLVMQDDGNLVLYRDTGGVTWASNTVQSGAIQPVSGTVTGVMSNRCTSYDADHYGVDIGTGAATPPIVATARGTVIAKGYDSGQGNYVHIQHNNGYVSRYMHLSKFATGLAVGQVKARGEFIGNVGSTGHSSGNHLHFEMRQNGVVVNLSSAYSCRQVVTQGQPIPFNFPGI